MDIEGPLGCDTILLKDDYVGALDHMTIKVLNSLGDGIVINGGQSVQGINAKEVNQICIT